MTNKKEHVIVNNPDKLQEIYDKNTKEIWVGFNSRHYDQYILKGILCEFDPKKINDYIIVKDLPGYRFSSLLEKIPLINYDVMLGMTDRGLKSLEGFNTNSNAASYVSSLTVNKVGNSYVIEIINPVDYASYVEFGHRTRGGDGWVDGKFMLTISEEEINASAPNILENKIKKELGKVFR